jgi:class 3 adenylate cyclase
MGESKTLTICYTDIKGSTALNSKLGNDSMNDLKKEHFRVEKALIARNSGKFVKSLGDGCMSSFNNPSDAIRFAAEFQCIKAKHPGLQTPTFQTKIGMAHDEVTVDETTGDPGGRGANLGARVVEQCEAGGILLESKAFAALKTTWGTPDATKYCRSLGVRELRGFDEQEEIFVFDWQQFIRHKNSIADLVKTQLEEAHFELFNVVDVPLSQPGLVFWPVVPRPEMNAIHRGQLEAIKLLSYCGWKTCLFIADSDGVFDRDGKARGDFASRVSSHAEKIGVSLGEIEYLSKVFDSESADFPKVLLEFKNLTKQFKVSDIFLYEGKLYQESQDIVMKKTILDFIRTIFTIVALQRFMDTHKDPVMVVSGADESKKYKNFIETRGLLSRANLVCNPILKTGEHQVSQDSHPPIWRSKNDFLQMMGNTNLMQWAFDLFVLLPRFPDVGITICSEYCSTSSCNQTPESCRAANNCGERLASSVRDRLGF